MILFEPEGSLTILDENKLSTIFFVILNSFTFSSEGKVYIISRALPSVICLHKSHLQQGVIVGWSNAWQFRDFAKILALDVFPVPLGPLKRYAGAIFFVKSACFSVMAVSYTHLTLPTSVPV